MSLLTSHAVPITGSSHDLDALLDLVGDRSLVLLGVLKGSFVFAADLLRALHYQDAHPQVDFMTLSSYGTSTAGRGQVRWTPKRRLAPGRHVVRLVVRDAAGNRAVRSWRFRIR